MLSVTRTFTVSAPPRLVVDYLKDLKHAEQWDPGTCTCERIDSGPVAEGAYWHHVSKLLGVTAELTYRLDELTDHTVVFVGEGRTSRAVGSIAASPEGRGSLITYHTELEMHGIASIVNPVLKRVCERRAAHVERRMATVLNRLPATPG